jgi:ABC-type nitrate/sulfonate/bicarbonate transport system substrate-binding protein
MRAAIAALVMVLTAEPGAARAAETVSAGAIGSPSGTLWPFFIGENKGFFAAAGVDLDLIYIPSTAAAIQQLSGGSLDIVASTGLPEPINAIDKGAPIAIVRIVAAANPYGVIARPAIKRIEDLKGKTVSLGGTTDITAIYFSRVMRAHGLGKGDYDVIVVGATAPRLAGIESGAVDATMLLPPVLFEAEAAGLSNLGLSIDYTRDLPFTGLEVSRAWAGAHLALAQKLLGAYDQSVRWFLDDANRDAAIDVLAHASKLSRENVTATYELFRKIAFFAPGPAVSRTLLKNLMKAQIEVGDRDSMVATERLVMPSLGALGP